MGRRPGLDAWEDLVRTATVVRVEMDHVNRSPRRANARRALRPALCAAAGLAACCLAVLHLSGAAQPVSADSGADSSLFSLTNQDRSSNGVHALTYSGTLQNIGEAGSYTCSGFTVHGRSADMIQRNYFSHLIPTCNQYVFSMMQAFGVAYRSAGENIGWVSGYGSGSGGSGATYINGAFMNSADHKANILDGNYTEMGVGSAFAATWSGSGTFSNVWMFSEEFAQVGSASPPPPPRPTPRPTSSPPRNSPAPPPPAQPAATVAPLPTPAPTPTPIPEGLLPANLPPPPAGQYEGLLPNSVESVLEAFLTL